MAIHCKYFLATFRCNFGLLDMLHEVFNPIPLQETVIKGLGLNEKEDKKSHRRHPVKQYINAMIINNSMIIIIIILYLKIDTYACPESRLKFEYFLLIYRKGPRDVFSLWSLSQ